MAQMEDDNNSRVIEIKTLVGSTTMVVNLDKIRNERLNPNEDMFNEFEYEQQFEQIFTKANQMKILDTTATLPSSLWIYFQENDLLLNVNNRESKLHIMYGSLLR